MLNNLLVLGLVPGTNFQITFSELLLLFDACLVLVLLLRKQWLLKKISYYKLYIHLYLSTKKGQQLNLQL
jgi:hypothetical protein